MVNICSQKYAYAAIDHEYGLETVMENLVPAGMEAACLLFDSPCSIKSGALHEPEHT